MKFVFSALSTSFLIGHALETGAATLEVDVRDGHGQVVRDAAVFAEPVNSPAPFKSRNLEIQQKGRKFLPLMTVVQIGSEIAFPNNDTVRHHVYSFSPTKPFELKLYSGMPGNPVKFDKPGLVVIGCNIHDQMIAYIQVVNTPYFATSGEMSNVRITDLQPGKYKVRAWHYRLAPGAAVPEKEIIVGKEDLAVDLSLNIAADAGSR